MPAFCKCIAPLLLLLVAVPGAVAVSDVRVLAASLRESSRAATAARPQAGSLEVSPSDLLAYISTGQLPAQPPLDDSLLGASTLSLEDREAAEDAADAARDALAAERADELIALLRGYERRLEEARGHALEAYRAVVERERQLRAAFEPELLRLQGLVEEASGRAAKAEARVMVERLQRMHYNQAAALDRSARFWEERMLHEKELTRQAQAQGRLEVAAGNHTTRVGAAAEAGMWQERGIQKARMEDWLASFSAQLQSEEALVQGTTLTTLPEVAAAETQEE